MTAHQRNTAAVDRSCTQLKRCGEWKRNCFPPGLVCLRLERNVAHDAAGAVVTSCEPALCVRACLLAVSLLVLLRRSAVRPHNPPSRRWVKGDLCCQTLGIFTTTSAPRRLSRPLAHSTPPATHGRCRAGARQTSGKISASGPWEGGASRWACDRVHEPSRKPQLPARSVDVLCACHKTACGIVLECDARVGQRHVASLAVPSAGQDPALAQCRRPSSHELT